MTTLEYRVSSLSRPSKMKILFDLVSTPRHVLVEHRGRGSRTVGKGTDSVLPKLAVPSPHQPGFFPFSAWAYP